MRFAPGTHKLDQISHRETFGEHNLLTRGQIVDHEVDEEAKRSMSCCSPARPRCTTSA